LRKGQGDSALVGRPTQRDLGGGFHQVFGGEELDVEAHGADEWGALAGWCRKSKARQADAKQRKFYPKKRYAHGG